MAIEKKSFRSGPFKDLIANAVQVENVLYLSGQVGLDAEGNVPSTLAEQAGIAYQSIGAILAEFGADMSNIVDETVFVTDMKGFMAETARVYKTRAEAYGGQPEVTQTVIGVTALVQENLKIEIKCVAHL